MGTAPSQVVRYAEHLFRKGDLRKGIRPQSFDQVYAVFDRDDHESYFEALECARALDGKLRNDDRQPVSFKPIVSVPCFELWLLLHYENIQAPLVRTDLIARLKRHISGYEKGANTVFAMTRDQLEIATRRANALADNYNLKDSSDPFTAVHELVRILTTLRS